MPGPGGSHYKVEQGLLSMDLNERSQSLGSASSGINKELELRRVLKLEEH